MKQSYWEENWLDKLFASFADDVQLDFLMFLLSRGNHGPRQENLLCTCMVLRVVCFIFSCYLL